MTEYIQIPPDSTGKRLSTDKRTQVAYDNLTGDLFAVGDTVVGSSSGATGKITGVDNQESTSGELYLYGVTGTFTDDEFLQVDGTSIARVNGENFIPFHLPRQVVVDPCNPTRKQSIDRFGAGLSTFTDGAPTLSPFGLLMVGEPQTIKNYRFAYSGNDGDFWDQEVSGGDLSYDSTAGVMVFTNPTTTGSLTSRTSHFYHPYSPGVGTLVEMSMGIGDSGKSNVRRRWGLFDDNNGMFWQLDGTTMSVVIRSNVTGSVVDTVVDQDDWNCDKLNGDDSLNFTLDVTKGNIYWIDFQWLGAGKVKFGVVEPAGSRITAHEFRHSNNISTIPYTRTGTLPVRCEQENTGTAASTSEMRWVCGSVKHTGQVPIVSNAIFSHSTGTTLISLDDTNGVVPILSGRPKTTFAGQPNRGIIRLRSVSYINNSTTNPVLITAGYTMDLLMTGESFVSHSADSIVEFDESATAVTYATKAGAEYLMPGDTITMKQGTSEIVHEFEMTMYADGTTQPVVSWTAEVVGTGSAEVGVVLQWEEILL